MPKIDFAEIKDLLSKGQYQKAMLNTHDFVQLALYQVIISALWFLGETKKLHIYLQKYMGTFKVSTFKCPEIEEAYQLGLISKNEKDFIKKLKKFRDSQGVAHHSIYFDKELEENLDKKREVENFIYESEKIIPILLAKSNKIGISHMQEGFNLIESGKIKVGDIIKFGHSKEDLCNILNPGSII
ncbi:MAG: hypothetical protein Q8L26_08000 [Candidatus Omnitrophota bacterium]|nr:hypothetical protein [Candidatus Omnitrophota bacterium]